MSLPPSSGAPDVRGWRCRARPVLTRRRLCRIAYKAVLQISPENEEAKRGLQNAENRKKLAASDPSSVPAVKVAGHGGDEFDLIFGDEGSIGILFEAEADAAPVVRHRASRGAMSHGFIAVDLHLTDYKGVGLNLRRWSGTFRLAARQQQSHE